MTDNLTLQRVVAGFGATVATTFTLGCMAVEDPKTATGMDLSIALASLVVALVSVVIAFVALRRTRQSEEKRRKLEVAAHLNHYYGDAKKWAHCVIDKLTDAAFLCEHDPKRMKDGEFFKRLNDLRSELSALLDKGRLLFPNEKEKVIGLWKEGAYRGLRQEALDVAVSGYDLVRSIDYKDPDEHAQGYRHSTIQSRRPAHGQAGQSRSGAALLRRRLFRLFIGVFARGRSLFGSFCAGTAPRTAPTRLFRAASPA